MKQSLAIVCALLAGLVIGNFSIKSDLRQANAEIKSLKEQLATRTRRDSGLRNITSLLRVPEPAPTATTDRPQWHPPVATAAPTNDSASAATGEVHVAHNRASQPEFEQQIKQAMELWKTRSQLARTSFVSNTAVSPEQTQTFDQTLATMNEQLGSKIKQWVDYMKQQENLTPETGLRMMNDLGGTVVSAYDELDRVLPADWRTKAGPEFQLFDFINPEVALPLGEVQGAFKWPGGPPPQ